MAMQGNGGDCEETFRNRLRRIVAARSDVTYAALSRGLGRNHAYLQQYLHRRTPRRLPLEDKLAIARLLAVPPGELGIRLPAAECTSAGEATPARDPKMPVFTCAQAQEIRRWVGNARARTAETAGSNAAGQALEFGGPTGIAALLRAEARAGIFALLHGDNAHQPTIAPGDMLLIDPSVTQAGDDSLHLVDLGEAGVAVRRTFRRGRDLVLLAAENLPAVVYHTVRQDELIVLGRVVALLRALSGGYRKPPGGR